MERMKTLSCLFIPSNVLTCLPLAETRSVCYGSGSIVFNSNCYGDDYSFTCGVRNDSEVPSTLCLISPWNVLAQAKSALHPLGSLGSVGCCRPSRLVPVGSASKRTFGDSFCGCKSSFSGVDAQEGEC